VGDGPPLWPRTAGEEQPKFWSGATGATGFSLPKPPGRPIQQQRAILFGCIEAQVLEDAERLIAAWNQRQPYRMPMLFSPTVGAAIALVALDLSR
jgi:hypothetical protein